MAVLGQGVLINNHMLETVVQEQAIGLSEREVPFGNSWNKESVNYVGLRRGVSVLATTTM